MFKAIGNWLKGLFSNLLRAFKAFCAKVTQVALKKGAAYLLDVAKVAVREMAQTQYSNPKKFEKAFERVKDYAKSEGLKVPDRIIDKLVQDAYVEFRAEF